MSKAKIIKETFEMMKIVRDETITETQRLFLQNLDLMYLDAMMQDQLITEYNKFIYLSRIAKPLYKITKDFVGIAKVAASISILYDTRTGKTGGCVYEPAYTNKRNIKYHTSPCVYFKPIYDHCYCPALDCAGFVSWMLFITGITNRQLLKDYKNKRYNISEYGNWNIYENLKKKEVVWSGIPKPGDLIFFQSPEAGHVGIVTEIDGPDVTEIVHSSIPWKGKKGGVKIEKTKDLKWFEGDSIRARDIVLGYAPEEISDNAKYVLGRLI